MSKEYEFFKSNHAWADVLTDARSTVSKESEGKEPSVRFKKGMLIAEHSVIRNLILRWKWIHIPSWIATHFSRHKFEKYISTQRTDRTGVPRGGLPQDAEVTFTGVANAQNVIDAWRKRLCFQSSPETRAYAVDLKEKLHEIEPEWADVLVPNCIYRAGCCEMTPCECNFYKNFLKRHPEITENTSIQERYDIYNKEFYHDR